MTTKFLKEAIMTRSEIKAIIYDRCPKCEHGAFYKNHPMCNHPYHPGWMGVTGTEWAATCGRFKNTGKVGYIEEKLIRK